MEVLEFPIIGTKSQTAKGIIYISMESLLIKCILCPVVKEQKRHNFPILICKPGDWLPSPMLICKQWGWYSLISL